MAEMDRLRLATGGAISVRAAVGGSFAVVLAGNAVVGAGRVLDAETAATLLGVPAVALAGALAARRAGITRADLGFRLPDIPRRPVPIAVLAAAASVAIGRMAFSLVQTRGDKLPGVVRLLVGTAIGEEAVHRGVVLALWCATGVRSRWIVLANLTVFVLWHLAVATKPSGFQVHELLGPLVGTPFLLWARLRCKSVLAPAILHATPNSFGLGH